MSTAAPHPVDRTEKATETRIASYLLTGAPQPFTIKKGAVWWIRGRNREDGAQVILQAVQSPDCL